MIQINNLTKTYGKKRVVDQFSLEIPKGMFGLLGPNGAGKTTLMRMITTIITPTSGQILYNGIHWSGTDNVRKRIGYLPQKFSVYPNIRVAEALTHLAILKGVTDHVTNRVEAIMEKLNLSDQKQTKIKNLSGGTLRRVGIAQALIGDPEIIVVDEPTAGLDPAERIRFRQLLHKLGQNATVIISTHIVEDIETTCDCVAVMSHGKLIKHGSISELKSIASGNVWEVDVSPSNLYAYTEKWNVISQRQLESGYRLHILSTTAPPEARSITPTLEDSYLALLGEQTKT